MNACTIVAKNYLAHARVLAESFREHHPAGSFSVLIVDADEPDGSGAHEPFDLLTPAQIGIERLEFLRMAAMYDVLELSTSLKPSFLKALLDSGLDDVAYFDPDIQIFTPLDDIAEHARAHGIVLTPHVTQAMPRDGLSPGEQTILAAGIYNLGFIAVARSADKFLDWWSNRLARECVLAPELGHSFVDQRWVDFVPALFDHYILRDEGCNVAHWNLPTRELVRSNGSFLVNGRPLRFFHFSGYDPELPHLLSKHQGSIPRILFSDHQDLQQLYLEYGRRLLERGYTDASRRSYGWDALPTGMPLDSRMRRLYRSALLEAERTGAEEPPNPFETPGDFVAWLREAPDTHGQAKRISRYLHVVRAEDPALQARFHDLRWLDGDRYLIWAATEGKTKAEIPAELVPDNLGLEEEEGAASTPAPLPGVNIVGYLRAELGIGEAARLIVAAVRHAGVPHAIVPYEETSSRQDHPLEQGTSEQPEYDVNLICVNADRLPAFTYDAGPGFFQHRYSIGVWWWEVAEFPEWMHPAFDIVNEIWVGSQHIAQSLERATSKPVLVFPLPLQIPEEPSRSREELGLPDRFVFLFSFDFFSVFQRKNPLALIDAFTRAFEPDEGPVLVLKSINGDREVAELERLRAAAAERPDIIVRDEYLSASDKNALMGTSDCYVSLHRSEGFGLTMAEAMAFGRPVIATAYSGNLDFMDNENSFLVPYGLTSIPEGCDPYPSGGAWADPDVEEAANLMRYVYEHPEEAATRGARAREHIRTAHSLERTAAFVTNRLDEIRHTPASHRPVPLAPAATVVGTREASRYLVEGPAIPLRAPSRYGALGVFARRLVFRLLRPYMARQREFEVAVVNALGELEAVAREGSRLASEAAMQAAASTAAALDDQRRLRRRSTDLQARLGATIAQLTPRVERAEAAAKAHGAELQANLAELKPRVERTEAMAGALDAELQANLAELKPRVERAESTADVLDAQLHAAPYMSDPELLLTTDDEGRPAIGYRKTQADGNVPLYLGFEEIFRGPEEFIRERQRVYLDVLAAHGPVLDVGCGRGELLDLLRESGIEAQGVDLDPGMVSRAREKGHEVVQEDALAYLKSSPTGSLGAISAIQVIEHLPYERLLELLELAHDRLASGGVLLLETVNPHAVHAFKAFWVDLTHKSPIFPEVAVALCQLRRFESAVVMFPNGTGDLSRDRREQGEYAVVAVKGAQ